MPFGNSYPLRNAGPKSDLAFVYAFFISSSAGAVMTAMPRDAADSALGLLSSDAFQDPAAAQGVFTMQALGSGLYRLFHKRCKFRALNVQLLIPTLATVADNRVLQWKTPVLNTDDPSQGRIDFSATVPNTNVATNFANGTIVQVTGVMGF